MSYGRSLLHTIGEGANGAALHCMDNYPRATRTIAVIAATAISGTTAWVIHDHLTPSPTEQAISRSLEIVTGWEEIEVDRGKKDQAAGQSSVSAKIVSRSIVGYPNSILGSRYADISVGLSPETCTTLSQYNDDPTSLTNATVAAEYSRTTLEHINNKAGTNIGGSDEDSLHPVSDEYTQSCHGAQLTAAYMLSVGSPQGLIEYVITSEAGEAHLEEIPECRQGGELDLKINRASSAVLPE